jgi:hypothetical protein
MVLYMFIGISIYCEHFEVEFQWSKPFDIVEA